jgi:hypothetical protein
MRSSLIAIAMAALACGMSSTAPASDRAQQVEYRDPAGRFTFSYDESFGTVSVGTDNGFGNRVAAVRFSAFSTRGIGGEAVLTQGPPSLDVQAAGGVYDDIVSGGLPASIKNIVDLALPRLTVANICEQFAREDHLEVDTTALASLTPQQRQTVAAFDRLGNIAPLVTRCTVTGDTITFDKEATTAPGGAKRRTYGAVRFLTGRYSAFHLIRASGTADDAVLEKIVRVVASFK